MIIDSYIQEYLLLHEFVTLCHQGLAVGINARQHIEAKEKASRILNRPEMFRSNEDRDAALIRAAKLEDFAQSQQARGFPYLYELAAIKLWSLLESAVEDVVSEEIRLQPRSRLPDLTRIKGSLVEFMDATPDEQVDFLIEKLKESMDTPFKKGCGRFESLLNAVKLGGSVDDAPRKALFELCEVRNVLVHRNARADRRFREACPWFGATPEVPIQLNHNHFTMYGLAVVWYLLEIARRLGLRKDLSIEQYQEVQRIHVEKIQVFLAGRDAALQERSGKE